MPGRNPANCPGGVGLLVVVAPAGTRRGKASYYCQSLAHMCNNIWKQGGILVYKRLLLRSKEMKWRRVHATNRLRLRRKNAQAHSCSFVYSWLIKKQLMFYRVAPPEQKIKWRVLCYKQVTPPAKKHSYPFVFIRLFVAAQKQ